MGKRRSSLVGPNAMASNTEDQLMNVRRIGRTLASEYAP
jgi:hypothetical protein